jgi:plasmid stabilization system protein ParE
MPPIIIYASEAEASLDEITDYLTNNLDFETAYRIYNSIIEEIERLAINPLWVGVKVPDLPNEYRIWLTAKGITKFITKG